MAENANVNKALADFRQAGLPSGMVTMRGPVRAHGGGECMPGVHIAPERAGTGESWIVFGAFRAGC